MGAGWRLLAMTVIHHVTAERQECPKPCRLVHLRGPAEGVSLIGCTNDGWEGRSNGDERPQRNLIAYPVLPLALGAALFVAWSGVGRESDTLARASQFQKLNR